VGNVSIPRYRLGTTILPSPRGIIPGPGSRILSFILDIFIFAASCKVISWAVTPVSPWKEKRPDMKPCFRQKTENSNYCWKRYFVTSYRGVSGFRRGIGDYIHWNGVTYHTRTCEVTRLRGCWFFCVSMGRYSVHRQSFESIQTLIDHNRNYSVLLTASLFYFLSLMESLNIWTCAPNFLKVWTCGLCARKTLSRRIRVREEKYPHVLRIARPLSKIVALKRSR
jgi:hypothetical protein